MALCKAIAKPRAILPDHGNTKPAKLSFHLNSNRLVVEPGLNILATIQDPRPAAMPQLVEMRAFSLAHPRFERACGDAEKLGDVFALEKLPELQPLVLGGYNDGTSGIILVRTHGNLRKANAAPRYVASPVTEPLRPVEHHMKTYLTDATYTGWHASLGTILSAGLGMSRTALERVWNVPE